MILCLESSADPSVIGLVTYEGKLVMEHVFSDRDRFATEVDMMLHDMSIEPARLKAIAIGIGPGSFTGLRVSLAFAKGLARGLKIPIWPVPSLQTIAMNLVFHWDSVAVISPAKRGHVHFALYEGETLEPKGEPQVLASEDLILHMTPDRVLVGPAVGKLTDSLRTQLSAYLPADDNLHRPTALRLAHLAREEWLDKTPPDIGSLVPTYGLDFPV